MSEPVSCLPLGLASAPPPTSAWLPGSSKPTHHEILASPGSKATAGDEAARRARGEGGCRLQEPQGCLGWGSPAGWTPTAVHEDPAEEAPPGRGLRGPASPSWCESPGWKALPERGVQSHGYGHKREGSDGPPVSMWPGELCGAVYLAASGSRCGTPLLAQ